MIDRVLRVIAIAAAALFLAGAALKFVTGLIAIHNATDVIDGIAYPVNFIVSLLIAAPGFFLWAWATRAKTNPN